MLIFLPGLTVLAFYVNLLPFLVLCIGLCDTVDMGHFGVSFLELLILFEQWAGHRLLSEKVTGLTCTRANRPILIPSVPVSEGIEI